jgi:hypothetical protein
MKAPICPYCGESARLLPKGDVDANYPRGMVWACPPCDAWVPVHANSLEHKPMGRLANTELRFAKAEALEAFTSLWKAWDVDRRTAYSWLAEKMGISMSECDFGKFDLKQCLNVFDIVQPYIPNWWDDED